MSNAERSRWALPLAGASMWLLLVATRLMAADERRERIVYTTVRPATLEVYLFEPGSSAKQITDGPGHNYDATFSPDGRWVVFSSERSGSPHLYAIDLQHKGPAKQLTRGRFMDAAPAFTPDGKALLFVSDRDGNADLFTMTFRPDDPDSVGPARNLTRHPGGDFRPAVSPDGETVAFSSDRDVGEEYPFQAEIYAMPLGGSAVRRLTTLKAMSGSPAWSGDGRTLFFYSGGNGATLRIWAMNSDGTQQRALTPKNQSALSPTVMPNGRIAFVTNTSDSFAIMSVAADGSDLRPESGTRPDCRTPTFEQRGRMLCTGNGSAVGKALEPNRFPLVAFGTHDQLRLPDRVLDIQGVHGRFCSISPDGVEVVTGQLRAVDSNDMHLVASHLDGSAAREVFAPTENRRVWATSWARRADLIAFTVGPQFADDDAVVDIWTVHGDGSKATNLTQGRFRNNAFPDLTADGSQLVFRSTRDGNKDIYLMNSDGTNVRRITQDEDVDTMPTISPNGDLIAFSSNDFQLYLQPIKDGKPHGSARLFQEYAPSVHPRFSPDGKWIAFASMRAWLNDEGPLSSENPQPYGEIFVAPVDGTSEPIRLTHNRWEDSVPCWGVMPSP